MLNGKADEIDWEKVKGISEEIKLLWSEEEKFWGQKSCLKWLNWGHKNSRFFHATTVQRKSGIESRGLR